MLRVNPELSLTYFEDITLAVIILGRGEVLRLQTHYFLSWMNCK